MRHLLPLLAFMLLAPPSAAQSPVFAVDLDLAGGDREITVAPGTTVTVRLLNKIAQPYSYTVTKNRIVQPPLANPFTPQKSRSALLPPSDPCQVRKIEDELATAKDEGEVKRTIDLHKTPALAQCEDQIDELVRRLTVEEVTIQKQLLPLKKGEELIVQVNRPTAGGGEKTWKLTLTTGLKGDWRVHYGFGFLPDEDEKFFTETDEDGDGFLITEEADRSGSNFEPTVLFTYRPAQSRFPLHFSAGLGFDLDSPVVIAGASYLIADNVSLFAGVAVHEQQRLKGIYEPGQELKEQLDASQLHDESFEINVIFGVAFNFNPFGKKKDSSTSSK